MGVGMAVLGENLVVVDVRGDSAIHVIRRSDGEVLHRFGRRGQGPGEFEGAWSVDPVPGDDDAFWVYDASLVRLTLVRLASDDGIPSVSSDSIINLLAEGLVIDPVWIDGRVISAGFFSGGRLGRFDVQGNMIGTLGEVPEAVGDFPPPVRQQAYQGRLQADPSRTRLVVATRHSDQLEIYDAGGRKLRRVYGPFRFEPESFGIDQRGDQVSMIPGDDLRFGYVGVTTTNDRVYALFSGRTNRFDPRREAPYGEFVHVFDWDGRLQGVLQLDTPTLEIAVDPFGETLYTTVEYPEPAVRAYSLPAIELPQ
jgi:hypothetical protein